MSFSEEIAAVEPTQSSPTETLTIQPLVEPGPPPTVVATFTTSVVERKLRNQIRILKSEVSMSVCALF